MPFYNLSQRPSKEIWPGLTGQFHHSDSHTFGLIQIEEGAVLPEHHHVHEQYTYVLEGRLEFTIGGETQIAEAGTLSHIPSNVPHSARALTKVTVLDAFNPVREDIRNS